MIRSHVLLSSKQMVPIIYFATETAQVIFLEKRFSTTFETKFRVFLVLIGKFVKKEHRLVFLKQMFPIICLGHVDAKSYVLEKYFFDIFCNERSCVSCSDLQVG